MAKKSTDKEAAKKKPAKAAAKKPAEKAEKKPAAVKAAVKTPAEKTAKKPAKAAEKKPAKKAEKKPAKKAPAAKAAPSVEAKKEPARKERVIEKIKFREKREVEILEKRKDTPNFIRQEFYKHKKLDDKWRTPRGCDSKKDEDKRGKGASPKVGYKSPDAARGYHPSGFYPVVVRNPTEIKTVDPKVQGAIIAAAVGRKKRNEMIKVANELRITVLNPRKGEI